MFVPRHSSSIMFLTIVYLLLAATVFLSASEAFVQQLPLQKNSLASLVAQQSRTGPYHPHSSTHPVRSSSATVHGLPMLPTELIASTAAAGSAAGEMNPLMTYLLQTVISNGVPSLFAILVIGFTARQFRSGKQGEERNNNRNNNNSPFAQLYDDLYGDQEQNKKSGGNMFDFFGSSRFDSKKELPKNTGVPAKQYLQVTHLNKKYDSFKYSLTAATQSKAVAAAQYRQAAWERTWSNALLLPHLSSPSDTNSMPLPSPALNQELQKLEQAFLKEAAIKQQEMMALQAEVQQSAIDEQMERMGMESVYQLDPAVSADNNNTATANGKSSLAVVGAVKSPSSFGERVGIKRKSKSGSNSRPVEKLGKLQAELLTLETDFIRNVISAVGPANAAAVRTAVLGNTGSLLTNMLATAAASDGGAAVRPLTSLLGGGGMAASVARKKRVFVTRFPGDASASQVANLREEVTAIVQSSRTDGTDDEVLVVLQTGGGTVTGYGLAAAQLQRLKQAGLKLTIAVEQVAASGGYMMACIADRIVASPFAVLGSIGVISDIPNVYERLKQEGIEFQTVTAGKYKRTLTPTKKVTKEDFLKTKEDVEDIFYLFRDFVAANRPQLDIEKVATGETWFGTAALELKLCDEIKTVDDVLVDFVDSGYDVFEIAYKPPPAETAFGRLLPVGADSLSSDGPVRSVVKWLVQTVASAVKSELSTSMDSINKPVQERYMAMDDTADRVRSQD